VKLDIGCWIDFQDNETPTKTLLFRISVRGLCRVLDTNILANTCSFTSIYTEEVKLKTSDSRIMFIKYRSARNSILKEASNLKNVDFVNYPRIYYMNLNP
jgi:hypothetical protein